MKIVIDKLKNSELSVKIDNRYIISKYSPYQEAEKLIATLKDIESKENILIIGEILGYWTKVATARLKKKIISIYFEKQLFENRVYKGKNDYLFGDIIDNLDLNSCYILIPDIAKIYWQDKIDHLFLKIKDSLNIEKINLSTELFFSKRWLLNSIRNIKNFSYFSVKKTDTPIIIISPSPHLTKHINFIKKNCNNFIIVAVASSLKILLKYNITPDYLVITDPSFYSKKLLNFIKLKNITLIQPITAPYIDHKKIFFSQNTELENYFLKNIDVIKIEETPTVTATAFLIAEQLTTNKIYNCGANFKTNDILLYDKNHPFFTDKLSICYKLDNLNSICYKQVKNYNFKHLKIFNEWFLDKQFYKIEELPTTKKEKKLPEINTNEKKILIELNKNLLKTIKKIKNYSDINNDIFIKYCNLGFLIKNRDNFSTFMKFKRYIDEVILKVGKIV